MAKRGETPLAANGATNWTRNLDAAGTAMLVLPHQQPVAIVPELLVDPDERRRVISTTWHQHPFPGNLIYWLARRHIAAVGRYYRIEPELSDAIAGPALLPESEPTQHVSPAGRSAA